MRPNLREEKKLWRRGYKYVVCLDESGRGPLSGPVVAAAVALAKLKTKNEKFKILLKGIKDSKKLTPRKREEFYKILIKNPAIKWGIGRVSEKVIDKINVLEATKLAMKRAIKNLEKKLKKQKKYPVRVSHGRRKRVLDFLILDGNFKIDLNIPQKSIVKADEKVFSCAIASIIAKVRRDAIMKKEAKKYPQYSFEQHKGYPTKYHRKMLKKYGPCQIHRKTFGPLKSVLK